MDEHPEGDSEVGCVNAHEVGALRKREVVVEEDGAQDWDLAGYSPAMMSKSAGSFMVNIELNIGLFAHHHSTGVCRICDARCPYPVSWIV